MLVVNIILTGSTIVSIILALTSILTAGVSAVILAGGWTAFITKLNFLIKDFLRARN
ncbi:MULTISPECIES: uberolysin/carnocyclin family circular bacteriocin [unclassified Caldicellulosiruptor]|uniref:uberolysin/carnocyclin family circular bacteriocin n=1 Tax=unclassified Caldicellulosiruptor TaxID=2622462 RepID=UPI0009FD8F1E|nr:MULTISPECIES: uberolysin/carnocyclin family circular bacteriocin [unclassified Caldicellulosiruptor]